MLTGKIELEFSGEPYADMEVRATIPKGKRKKDAPKEGEIGWINPLWEEDLKGFGGNESAARSILSVRNFRSQFRLDIRDKIVKWLDTPKEEREFRSPLSYRQWECIQPYDPSRYYR